MQLAKGWRPLAVRTISAFTRTLIYYVGGVFWVAQRLIGYNLHSLNLLKIPFPLRKSRVYGRTLVPKADLVLATIVARMY